MSNVEQVESSANGGDVVSADSISKQEVMKRPSLKEVRIVEDAIPILDTARFEHMQRIASVMASASMIPDHVRKGKSDNEIGANCFLIVNQAVRWGMDPFALAQHAYFVHGKLGWEGKVIAAAVNSDPLIDGRLEYEFKGDEGTDGRTVTVSGKFKDTGKTALIEGSVGKWKTSNENWKKSPDQMLTYRGAREWARRHMPDRMLGVYSSDELEDMGREMVDATPQRASTLPPPPDPPEEVGIEQSAKPEMPDTPSGLDRRNATDAEVVDNIIHEPETYLSDLEGQLSGAVEKQDRALFDEIWDTHVTEVVQLERLFPADADKASDFYRDLVKRLPR